ncbi:MAG: hypothetical protein K2G25_03430 [Oscillospiraceae bacterium]|nr:hypothetical protein [Oscillospiraceae bacterium]
MESLIQELMTILKADDTNFQVYPSFDAVPVREKSRQLFVVLAPETVKLNCCAREVTRTISSFTADFRVSVLVPMTTPSEHVLEFFYSKIVPRMHRVGCHLESMQMDNPKADTRLQKLVYSGLFRLRGLYLPETPALPEVIS